MLDNQTYAEALRPPKFEAFSQPHADLTSRAGDLELLQHDEAVRPVPGFDKASLAALRLEAGIAQMIGPSQPIPHDPDFVYTREMFKEDTKDLPDEYHAAFMGAYSQEHRQWIRAKALQELEDNRTLERQGAGGNFGYRIAANLVDPVQVVTSLATGPLTTSYKAGRIARMFASGAVSGVSNAAMEAYLNSKQVGRDNNDIAMAGMMGLALGSLGPAFSKTQEARLRLFLIGAALV